MSGSLEQPTQFFTYTANPVTKADLDTMAKRITDHMDALMLRVLASKPKRKRSRKKARK